MLSRIRAGLANSCQFARQLRPGLGVTQRWAIIIRSSQLPVDMMVMVVFAIH